MLQGVRRMDVHWSQCALSVGNTEHNVSVSVFFMCVCVLVCVHIYSLLLGRTLAALRQSWSTWLCLDVKCYWITISQQQNEQSWNVSLWLWDQMHCCTMGQKTLDEEKQNKNKGVQMCTSSLSLSLSLSLSKKLKGYTAVTFIIFIQIVVNSKLSRTINS